MGEMTKTSVKYCRKCKYSYNHSQTEIKCGYYSKTGLRRGCPVGMCDKFEKKGEVKMTDETKNEIKAVLTLVSNGVSIALEKKDDGCICFFDTAEYCRTGKYKGVSVKITDLVR